MILKRILILATVALTSGCLDFDLATEVDGSFEGIPEDGAVLPFEVRHGDTLILSEDHSFALLGALRVREGAVLVIEPGVTVTAAGSQPPALFIVIEAGARILAEGTDRKPIVLTASDQIPGAWGGLIVAGKAPINIGASAIAEIGDIVYGGSDEVDNSGVIKYLRVEYTGSSINSEREHNGVTFYGVGSGTTVDFLQTFQGADDGIELFGGTVNLSHVICVGSQDDQFDYTQGWSGTAEYLYIQQIDDPNYVQDRGIEADNLSSNNAAVPFSAPTLRNVTLVGFPSALNLTNNGSDALRIREGTKGHFSQVVVRNYPGSSLDLRSLVTIQNLLAGDLTFENLYFEGITEAPEVHVDEGEVVTMELLDAARELLNEAIVTDPSAGADFDSWRGNFARLE